MLIHHVQDNSALREVTLALTSNEARELLEKFAYLLNNPDFHHDHMEDFPNDSVLHLVVIQFDQLDSYDEALRDRLTSLHLKE